MAEFSSKVRIDPQSMSARLLKDEASKFTRRMVAQIKAQVGMHCCETHRAQTVQTSALVTAFMFIVANLERQTGDIDSGVLEQALAVIRSETLGEPMPPAAARELH